MYCAVAVSWQSAGNSLDNSPALEGWAKAIGTISKSRQGRKRTPVNHHSFVPAGLEALPTIHPALKGLGYSRRVAGRRAPRAPFVDLTPAHPPPNTLARFVRLCS